MATISRSATSMIWANPRRVLIEPKSGINIARLMNLINMAGHGCDIIAV
jgi:hypothetical protein